jgi:hypothetical protein
MDRTYLKGHILVHPRPYWAMSKGPHISYAMPGGGPVLKTEVGWRHINGLIWNWNKSCRWFMFRRVSR